MCGICGVFDSSADEESSRKMIGNMSDAISHRGPDSHGVYVERPIALGHRRLAIIDIDSGQQPMSSADGSCTIVFNGEIYNFKSLRDILIEKGHHFRTDCDTEVVLAAYLEFGHECSVYLRGMFAFAIWDSRSQSIFISRDRLGIKPLYYSWSNKRLVFASEIAAIQKADCPKLETNLAALDYFVSLGYVPGEKTMFKSIRKLPPGHQMYFANGNLEVKKYWDVESVRPSEVSLDKALGEFDELLTESVGMHLMSDVPLGAFLSGGLDSSAIVYYMNKVSSTRVKTFSVGFRENDGSSELSAARKVAEVFDTEHHELILEPGNFFESLKFCISRTEEPLVESAAVALYELSKLAKKHVTVILSGEGGDEILAGYPLYNINRQLSRIRKICRLVPAPIMRAIIQKVSGTEKSSKYADWLQSPISRRYLGISNDVTSSIRREMYTPEIHTMIGSEVEEYFRSLFDKLEDASALQRMSYTDIKTWLPDDLLLKADKMTMAASLELRVPFLDHKVLEYSLQLPDRYRLNGNVGKYLLKKLMEGRLPSETIYQKKKGFPVPIERWFRNELYDDVAEILLSGRALERNYFRQDYVRKTLDRHKSGKENRSRRIMSLLTLELWHRQYID
jgi:asparagine synthase (glutamine-hydrolysing)